LQDGELLDVAEIEGFDVLVTPTRTFDIGRFWLDGTFSFLS